MLTFEPGERELLDIYLYCRCHGHILVGADDRRAGPRCVKSGRLVRGVVG